uniref:Exonuclease domain-containing protein n=1 Tax=viral metagenome TaxID=1070528 RepID=A0A6C0IIM2_9ZZZZ
MKVLIFDTETTGLPTERNASIMDVSKWPYIVQLSYILYDSETKQLIDIADDLIQLPIGVEITPGSEAIHRISQVMCQAHGIRMLDALNCFNKALDNADLIVGHNLSFDKRMLMVESKRLGRFLRFNINGVQKPEYCTMKKTTDICKLEFKTPTGKPYFKYPTLSELHFKLFDNLPKGTHNALADILICLRCYLKVVDNYDFVTDHSDTCDKLKNMYIENCL